MRITFLVRDVWALGGTVKATLDAAAALADRGHDVTVASCVRSKATPAFAPDPRVTVVNLWDARKRGKGGERLHPLDRWRADRPSVLDEHHVNPTGASSALLDHRVARFLRRVRTDVVIGTHPALNLYLARLRRPAFATVGQEHSFLERHKEPVRKRITDEYGALDAIACATEADVRAYRDALRDFRGRVAHVPNPVPPVAADTAEPGPVVMAAGRLAPGKDFATLIRAFARTGDRFGEWRLRLYGRGGEERALAQLIEDTRAEDRIELRGPVVPLDPEWSDAAIAVVPSLHESFGLTMVEAMSAGVPVVAADAPNGPKALVDPDVNALQFEPKDVAGLQRELERLMGDPGLRAKLAEAGRATARRYEPDQVAERYEALLRPLVS